MQKRNEANKQEKLFFRTKLKHTAIVMLCIFFALSTVYAVDISTYKLKRNELDQYALRITKPNVNTIRLDLVGNRYFIDIKNIRAYAGKLSQKTKSLITDVKEKLR